MQKNDPESVKKAALAQLPKNNAVHWVARRKAQVVRAVRKGWLSLDEARRRYRLSFEEFLEWQRAFSRDGVGGLVSRRCDRKRAQSQQRQRAHRSPAV
jgi:hypothetical protein